VNNTNPTISTYNRYAEVYDSEVVDFWQNFPRQTLRKFESALPGSKVLNLGSGTGQDALLLKELGLDVTCLDASSSMVQITKHLGFPSILSDFRSLDLNGHFFDGVWAYTSLIHISSDEALKVVRRLRDVLPNDGIVLFGAIEGEGAKDIERKSMPGAKRFFKYYSPKELDALMRQAGYELIFSEDYQPHNSIYLNRMYRVG
jgi:SAM-dependent methyltransferase